MPLVNIQTEYTFMGYSQIEIPEGKEIEDISIKWNSATIKFTDGTSIEIDDLNMSFEDGDTKRPDYIKVLDEDDNNELYEKSGW